MLTHLWSAHSCTVRCTVDSPSNLSLTSASPYPTTQRTPHKLSGMSTNLFFLKHGVVKGAWASMIFATTKTSEFSINAQSWFLSIVLYRVLVALRQARHTFVSCLLIGLWLVQCLEVCLLIGICPLIGTVILIRIKNQNIVVENKS